jgi:hypothetical protein
MRSRIRRIRRSLQIAAAIVIAALVAMPDAVFAASAKSMDAMSQQELDRFVQELNESANWRKYQAPAPGYSPCASSSSPHAEEMETPQPPTLPVKRPVRAYWCCIRDGPRTSSSRS